MADTNFLIRLAAFLGAFQQKEHQHQDTTSPIDIHLSSLHRFLLDFASRIHVIVPQVVRIEFVAKEGVLDRLLKFAPYLRVDRAEPRLIDHALARDVLTKIRHARAAAKQRKDPNQNSRDLNPGDLLVAVLALQEKMQGIITADRGFMYRELLDLVRGRKFFILDYSTFDLRSHAQRLAAWLCSSPNPNHLPRPLLYHVHRPFLTGRRLRATAELGKVVKDCKVRKDGNVVIQYRHLVQNERSAFLPVRVGNRVLTVGGELGLWKITRIQYDRNDVSKIRVRRRNDGGTSLRDAAYGVDYDRWKGIVRYTKAEIQSCDTELRRFKVDAVRESVIESLLQHRWMKFRERLEELSYDSKDPVEINWLKELGAAVQSFTKLNLPSNLTAGISNRKSQLDRWKNTAIMKRSTLSALSFGRWKTHARGFLRMAVGGKDLYALCRNALHHQMEELTSLVGRSLVLERSRVDLFHNRMKCFLDCLGTLIGIQHDQLHERRSWILPLLSQAQVDGFNRCVVAESLSDRWLKMHEWCDLSFPNDGRGELIAEHTGRKMSVWLALEVQWDGRPAPQTLARTGDIVVRVE